VYRVVDVYGNNATCQFNISVVDLESPTIECGASVVVGTGLGRCNATVRYDGPVGHDNCPDSVVAQVDGPAFALGADVVVGVGRTSLKFNVTDTAGRQDSCGWNVTVEDREAPSIACPPSVVVSTEAGVCSAVVNFGALVVADNCGVDTVTLLPLSVQNGSRFSLGVTSLTYVVVDVHGLSKNCSFNVTVVDNELPVVSCPTGFDVDADVGICGAVVNYTIGVTDNCLTSTTSLKAGLASGGVFSVGQTSVQTVVSDGSNNTVACNFGVAVADRQAPVVTCSGNISRGTDAGLCSALVVYSTVNVTDNCAGSSVVMMEGQVSGSAFAVGTTRLSFSGRDQSNNTHNCSFFVGVTDTELPRISESLRQRSWGGDCLKCWRVCT
jgi:hypothetical protein